MNRQEIMMLCYSFEIGRDSVGSMQESELAIRRLRYRLNRQGMLELDAWLAPLLSADFNDQSIIEACEILLACEPPELQAMMQGHATIPEVLERWLK